MNHNNQDSKHSLKIKNLFSERKKILSMPPDKALYHIIDSPQPAALVHSFPDEDLYFLIHDIGIDDALPILSLASEKQWEYMLDMDIWVRDRIDIQSTEKWLSLLGKADFQRSLNWLASKKTDLFELYLFKNIEVRIREHDQDPSEFGDDYFSFDDYFYIKTIPPARSPAPDMDPPSKKIQKSHQELLHKLLDRLANFDHLLFQKILLEASHVIPAELEEEIYRFRNTRMAEKGFLPFNEAVGVYQPLGPDDIEKPGKKSVLEKSEIRTDPSVPFRPISLVEKDNLFSDSLAVIDSDEMLAHLQSEFVGLCNQVIVADQKKIQSPEELRIIVKKVCGFINIGLESLTGKQVSEKGLIGHSIQLIKKHLLSNIFRVGYGAGLKLKWQAEKWLAESWFIEKGLSLTFWGEEWMGTLGGLLIKRPLFFDNYKTGVIYREFNTLEDIEITKKKLNEIITFDQLLSLMKIKLESLLSYGFLTYKNILLTLWIEHYLHLDQNAKPVDFSHFRTFYLDLWDPGVFPCKIRQSMKENFLIWLSGCTGLTDHDISHRTGQILDNLFDEIENEYGEVSINNLDPRYINLFLLKT